MIRRNVGQYLRLARSGDVLDCYAPQRCWRGWSVQWNLLQTRGLKKQRRAPVPAPATKKKAGHYNWSRVTPEEIKRKKEEQAEYDELLDQYTQALHLQTYKKFEDYERSRQLYATASDCQNFVDGFAQLLVIARKTKVAARTSHVLVPDELFLDLKEEHGLSDDDVLKASAGNLLQQGDRNFKDIGRALLWTASHAGSAEATLHIMNHAHIQSKDRPGIMKSAELERPRQHLRNVVKEMMAAEESAPLDFPHLTLAGQIAKAEGQLDYAVQLWERAVPGAVAFAKTAEENRTVVQQKPHAAHLLAPWIELANAYRETEDVRELTQTIEIGCQQDDPTSHYFASLDNWEADKDTGLHTATSRWLYHATKAAASGYPKAIHELGGFYASNTWPYLEDEPPDQVKPTPFDRYPPEHNTGRTSAWESLRTALGYPGSIKGEPWDALFHTAAYPSTVEGRLKMAVQWLEVAMGFNWAPSYLTAARLYLSKEIYSDLAAPKEAIRLSDARYSYASKAELTASEKKEMPEAQYVPNPLYDPIKAKDCIREIFHAGLAFEVRMDYLAGRRGVSHGLQSEFATFRRELNYNVDKWFRFQEVYTQFLNQKNGLHDPSQGNEDLLAAARQICEEQEWDIYAEHDGGLLYRHGMGKR